jgi:hypothetical protein
MFKYFRQSVDSVRNICNIGDTHGKTQTTYMRTIKALVCVAALATGLATAMAQSNVYSLNVVGYYNVTVPANTLVLIANQLNTTNNTIASLIPNGPPFAQFYKYDGIWSESHFDDIDPVWLPNGNATLNPGEGGFYKSPTATTLTFVGEVLQGALSNPLPAVGVLGVRSSMVPQAGLITTDLKYPGEPFDQVYKYTGIWGESHFDDIDPVWLPSEPTFGVGEAMMVKKVGATTAWTRNFTVQ